MWALQSKLELSNERSESRSHFQMLSFWSINPTIRKRRVFWNIWWWRCTIPYPLFVLFILKKQPDRWSSWLYSSIQFPYAKGCSTSCEHFRNVENMEYTQSQSDCHWRLGSIISHWKVTSKPSSLDESRCPQMSALVHPKVEVLVGSSEASTALMKWRKASTGLLRQCFGEEAKGCQETHQ